MTHLFCSDGETEAHLCSHEKWETELKICTVGRLTLLWTRGGMGQKENGGIGPVAME